MRERRWLGGDRQRAMETAQHRDRLATTQPDEIAMFQISEVQASLAFNGRRNVWPYGQSFGQGLSPARLMIRSRPVLKLNDAAWPVSSEGQRREVEETR